MAEILSSDRVFIAGQTGSGKTTLAKVLCAPLRRLIVLDSKDELTDWNLEEWDDETREALLKGEEVRVRVIRPLGAEGLPIWEDAFQFAMTIGNVTVYVDEAYNVLGGLGAKASIWITEVWTRGRSYGVGGWVSAQRPSWIPGFWISEAQHRFCFRLDLLKDRKSMAENGMGEQVLDPIPETDEHGFWYRGKGMHTSQYIPDLFATAPAPRAPRLKAQEA